MQVTTQPPSSSSSWSWCRKSFSIFISNFLIAFCWTLKLDTHCNMRRVTAFLVSYWNCDWSESDNGEKVYYIKNSFCISMKTASNARWKMQFWIYPHFFTWQSKVAGWNERILLSCDECKYEKLKGVKISSIFEKSYEILCLCHFPSFDLSLNLWWFWVKFWCFTI